MWTQLVWTVRGGMGGGTSVWYDGGRELGVQDRLGVQGGSKLPSAGEETFYGCSGFLEGSFQGPKNEHCAY